MMDRWVDLIEHRQNLFSSKAMVFRGDGRSLAAYSRLDIISFAVGWTIFDGALIFYRKLTE